MNNTIIDLIPQRAPIVMVDEFLGIEGNVSRTRFTIRQDNVFVDNDIFSACGLIEHIAQSAAARVGFVFKEEGKEIPLGYIGSVNDFHVVGFPHVNDVVETKITVIQNVFNITLIEAACYVDNNKIASCKMKIFLDYNEA